MWFRHRARLWKVSINIVKNKYPTHVKCLWLLPCFCLLVNDDDDDGDVTWRFAIYDSKFKYLSVCTNYLFLIESLFSKKFMHFFGEPQKLGFPVTFLTWICATILWPSLSQIWTWTIPDSRINRIEPGERWLRTLLSIINCILLSIFFLLHVKLFLRDKLFKY